MCYGTIPVENDGWIAVVNSKRDDNYNACCPVCMARFLDVNDHPQKSGTLRYRCGGGWYRTVDRDGNPIWTGRCGLPLKQRELVFTEEQP